MSDRPKLLGDLLTARRKELGLSLAQTVKRCEKPISMTYLAKLEGGGVRSPSPFILHELSHALTIPYPTIMEIAGYVYCNRPDRPLARNAPARCRSCVCAREGGNMSADPVLKLSATLANSGVEHKVKVVPCDDETPLFSIEGVHRFPSVAVFAAACASAGFDAVYSAGSGWTFITSRAEYERRAASVRSVGDPDA